jgi:hypothetical protein
MPDRTRASMLASLLCLCAALDVSHTCGHRSVRQARLRRGRTSRPVAAAGAKVRLTLDLGKDGEPKGETSVVFTPLLSRSVFVQVDLRVPLGMVIEETEKDDPFPGRVIVTGALPGYSANGKVLAGDFVRGVTAYRTIMTGAPMWQQVISYTPQGKMQLKRLFFRTEGATFEDVREAIASHREEGANQTVSLVLERPVDVGSGQEGTPRLELDELAAGRDKLQDIIISDLKKGGVKSQAEEELDQLSVPERANKLLSPDDDIFKRNL